MSMQDAFWALVALGILLCISQWILQHVRLFRTLFLPSSLIAGFLALLLGPQVLGEIAARLGAADSWLRHGLFPPQMSAIWASLPGLLISVVFAALLMGKPIPGLRKIWYTAGPQVCFGQTLAWGQYVVGLLLAIFVLAPMFGLPEISGALIEIAFEGGHGTAAGMGQAFHEAGWPEGQDLALGLATVGLVGGVVLGTILINLAVRRGVIQPTAAAAGSLADMQLYSEEITAEELGDLRRDKEQESQPTDPLSLHLGLVALAIGLGWLILAALRWGEAVTWGAPDAQGEVTRVFTHVPLFPMAMIGGVLIQIVFDRLGKSDWISHRLMSRISGAALDYTIVAALGTLSLQAIGDNVVPFLLLAVAGTVWNLFVVIVIAPRIIPTSWFERSIGDFGQSMGVTVTGLLLMRVADPINKSGALESFGYKQMMFEPIVGGGLFTGASIGLILALGAPTVLGITAAITVFWVLFGFLAFGRLSRQNRLAERSHSHHSRDK